MAKGNLFLGTASGKVGDVVMYRANGEQCSRVRNRHPRNPNSTKQAIQRAVLATVAQLYSIGQELFDHSFQGKSVGRESQRFFLKRNADILRAAVIADLNAGNAGAACAARVVAPGLTCAVPFVGALVANGNYDNRVFGWNASSYGYSIPAPASAQETVGEYATRVGLVAGDIYTFGYISNNSDTDAPLFSVNHQSKYAGVYRAYFGYIQFLVPETIFNSSELVTGKKLSEVFEVAGGNVDLSDLVTIGGGQLIDLMNLCGDDEGCIFCIRSRWDSDLRSTSFLMPGTAEMAYGLATDSLLPAWRDKAGLNDVELILDGSNFNGIEQGGGLVITNAVVSGVAGLSNWPMRDTQKLDEDITGDSVTVAVVGHGIEQGNLGVPINPSLGSPLVVSSDGTSATVSISKSVMTDNEWVLVINGEQYGGSLEFTE